ncbi:MAG: S8 family serine peptidase, partial [Promethearchaeota archaeon]
SEEVKYVTYVVSVDEGILQSISGFDHTYDPYIGEFPLLLNETRTLVNADTTDTTGSEVIVAILSTGINDPHPMVDDMDDDDLTVNDPKVVVSYDAYHEQVGGDTDETEDENGRGTALASIVAGTAAVGGKLEAKVDFTYPFPYGTDQDYETQELDAWINIGTQMGLAPEAYLFDVKITEDDGSSFDEGAVIHGIEWSVEHGADVILLDDISDMSVAGSTVMIAIEAATSLGSLVIVPAGDFEEYEGFDDDYIVPYYTIHNAASEITALTVGATTETNSLWVRSERGPVPGLELSKPDVVAPGVHMLAANTYFADNEANNPGGWEGGDPEEMLYYDVFSGTAVAAAVAAGASARLIEAYPGASPTAIKIALRQGATDLGFNEMAQGKGLINLAEAMDTLLNAPKQADNWVGHRHYKYSSPFTATYQDFDGVKILFDGSWTDTSGSLVDHDWSDLTNGNLTSLGVSSNWQHPYEDTPVRVPVDLETLGPSDWQHPYNDTVAGYYWHNVSYSSAERLTVSVTNLTIRSGDNFTVYQSDVPNDPNPSTLISTTLSNISSTTDYITNENYNNLYFVFGSDGDGTATDIFGMYGSIFLHGSTWWNVSYPGATTVTVWLDTLRIADGDNFTVYYSDIPNDPDPTSNVLVSRITNITSTQSWTTPTSYNCLYFRFIGNGDGATSNSPSLWGMYGSIELGIYASDAIDTTNFEFTELDSELDSMGAIIEYWHSVDAEAPPTATILEYYDVYVLAQPLAGLYSGAFNLPNETAYYTWLSGDLISYLDNGGRVLFIGDQEYPYYNYATNALGVTWNQGGGGGPTTDFVNHALLTTPFVIEELLIDAPYTYLNGTVNTLVRESGAQTIVYYDANNGKAVFVADEDVFNDELWDEPFSATPDRFNNSQFALNIFYWFTGITYQSGEQDPYDNHFKIASYSCPQIMTDGNQWELEVEIQNIGNSTSQAWIAFGLDHNPDPWVNLGAGAFGNDPDTGNDGIFITPDDDNANGSWQLSPDFDIGTSLSDTTIEFYYNISENYPIDQIAFPLIMLKATGVDRQTDECYLSLNGIQISPLYETNTTAAGGLGESGESWYPIYPMSTLKQYNNTVTITVPENITLRLDSFQIVGYNFTNSLGNIQHVVTPALAPYEKYTVSYQYTPSGFDSPTYFTPRVQVYPYDPTYAYISPGYVTPDVIHTNIKVDLGHTGIPSYYYEPNSDIYAIDKIVRRGDLPLLY